MEVTSWRKNIKISPHDPVYFMTSVVHDIMHAYAQTCLQHLLSAEVGMLGGAIWSKTPPVALKRGMTIIKTATETSPKHKTSAFCTLQRGKRKSQVRYELKQTTKDKRVSLCIDSVPKRQKPGRQYQTCTENHWKNLLKDKHVHQKNIYIRKVSIFTHGYKKSKHACRNERTREKNIFYLRIESARTCKQIEW